MAGAESLIAKNVKSFGLYIDRELNTVIKERALKDGLTKSGFICKAVEKYLKKIEHKPINYPRKYAFHVDTERVQHATIFLPKDLKKAVAAKAKKEQMSMNNFIFHAIREYLGMAHPKPHVDLIDNPYKQIAISMNSSLYQLLEEAAEKKGLTKTQIVCNTIKEYYNIEHTEAKRKL